MIEIKKTEEWAFFFFFFGGILLILNTLIGVIVYSVSIGNFDIMYMHFVDGFGLFTLFAVRSGPDNLVFAGFSINLLVGIIALLLGFKLFIPVFYNIITKIDVAIVGLVMFLLGLGTFSIPGLVLAIGGVYCFIYRMTVEGANNKTAK